MLFQRKKRCLRCFLCGFSVFSRVFHVKHQAFLLCFTTKHCVLFTLTTSSIDFCRLLAFSVTIYTIPILKRCFGIFFPFLVAIYVVSRETSVNNVDYTGFHNQTMLFRCFFQFFSK